MNINRAGKQTKAYWRSQERCENRWLKENHKWTEVQKMLQGHAAGWTDGVAWFKRNLKKIRSTKP